jgi:ribosomal protein S3
MKGIKVQVSGRLNGAEIARSEWKRDVFITYFGVSKLSHTHHRSGA